MYKTILSEKKIKFYNRAHQNKCMLTDVLKIINLNGLDLEQSKTRSYTNINICLIDF